MLGNGTSKDNNHFGDTYIRNGSLFVDEDAFIGGDLELDGTLVFNGDVSINPPACLNTDCINSVSGAGITVSDDIDVGSNGNNVVITNKLNSVNTTNTGVRINNSYTLPVDALSANVGDVLSLITPAPLATVAFTTPTTATGRIVQNFFQMTNPTTSYNSTTYNPLYTNSNGSDIINTADIAVGGSVRFRTKGYLYNGTAGVTAFGQFRLFIGIGNTSSTFDFYSNDLFIRDVGSTVGDPNVGRGWWEINVTVTKINASNDCTVGVSGIYNCVASTGVTSDTFDIQFYDNPTIFTTRLPNNSSSNTVIPAPFWTTLPTTFKLELAYKETAFAAAAIATEYTIDYLNVDQNVLATTTAPATDHLSLANLNGGTGDGGHINLYDRRGVKPMTGTVDMNANDLNNVKDINGRGGLNLLQVQNTNGLFYLDGGEIRMTADTSINLYPTANLRLGNGGQDISINPTTKTNHFGQLDMIGNNISNVNQVSSSGTLTLIGALGNRCDIGVAGATRLEVENTRVFISQFAELNIHDRVIWTPPNQMPSSYLAGYTYIFVGSRSTATTQNINVDCKIMGLGKDVSFINYTGTTTLFNITDVNVKLEGLTITSSQNDGLPINATNFSLGAFNNGREKILNMKNVQIRNSKRGCQFFGFDLIDLNNCLFTYIESGFTGAPQPFIQFTATSKVQLSSCELLRFYQEASNPTPANFYNGDMVAFRNDPVSLVGIGAINVTGCLLHPQQNQNGLYFDPTLTVLENTVSSNTFIDINLNTPTYQVLSINTTAGGAGENSVIEGNSITPNLRAQLTYVFSGVNATNTVLSGGSNPNVVNTGGLAITLQSQFASLTAAGVATYLKKRSANFLITASANLQVISGGANQRVGLGLRVNGIDIPNGYSFVSLDSSGTSPKQTTLNFTGVASKNDQFELTIINASGNNDVLVSDVNFAGIEI